MTNLAASEARSIQQTTSLAESEAYATQQATSLAAGDELSRLKAHHVRSNGPSDEDVIVAVMTLRLYLAITTCFRQHRALS